MTLSSTVDSAQSRFAEDSPPQRRAARLQVRANRRREPKRGHGCAISAGDKGTSRANGPSARRSPQDFEILRGIHLLRSARRKRRMAGDRHFVDVSTRSSPSEVAAHLAPVERCRSRGSGVFHRQTLAADVL